MNEAERINSPGHKEVNELDYELLEAERKVDAFFDEKILRRRTPHGFYFRLERQVEERADVDDEDDVKDDDDETTTTTMTMVMMMMQESMRTREPGSMVT